MHVGLPSGRVTTAQSDYVIRTLAPEPLNFEAPEAPRPPTTSNVMLDVIYSVVPDCSLCTRHLHGFLEITHSLYTII